MKPLVTALIDTFNHEKYIEQALVSVVDQGLSPSELEIVVVDDGSTDTTPSIVEKFLPRIRYLRKKNGGQASAFNAGFPETHGQVVAILDGDDWWAKGKLARVLEALERNPDASAIGHAYYRYDERTREEKVCGPLEETSLSLATPTAAQDAFSKWAFLQPSALTVRRRLLERVIPIPEVLVFSADSPITFASMALGVRVLPSPLSFYRLHQASMYESSSADPEKLRRRYEMDDVMFSILWGLLSRLGVPPVCISTFIDPAWVWINRACLQTFGGSRWKTLRTEMRYFRITYKNPTLAYRLFKYAVMAPATLLVPPRQFYKMRDWYAHRNLGRLRDLIFKEQRRVEEGQARDDKFAG